MPALSDFEIKICLKIKQTAQLPEPACSKKGVDEVDFVFTDDAASHKSSRHHQAWPARTVLRARE